MASRPIAERTVAWEEPDSGNGDGEGAAPRTVLMVTDGAAAAAVVDGTDVGMAAATVDVVSCCAVAGAAVAVVDTGSVDTGSVVTGSVDAGSVVAEGVVTGTLVAGTVVLGGAEVVVRGGSHRLSTDITRPVRAQFADPDVSCRPPAKPQASSGRATTQIDSPTAADTARATPASRPGLHPICRLSTVSSAWLLDPPGPSIAHFVVVSPLCIGHQGERGGTLVPCWRAGRDQSLCWDPPAVRRLLTWTSS